MPAGNETFAVRDEKLGTVYDLKPGTMLVVGRPAADHIPDVPCEDKRVSRRHCELHGEADGLRIVDVSASGTFLNGKRIAKEATARGGDRIVLGHDYTFVVLASSRGEESATDASAATVTPDRIPDGRRGAVAGPDLRSIGVRYRVKREIGRGGMGVVYEAHDALRNRPCAIKRLLSTGGASHEAMERFGREAMLGALLGEHPNIVSTFDLGTIPQTGELYCAMDLVEGLSLKWYIKDGIGERMGVRLVLETARAVDFAHARGVIHRDIKPENILVDRQGRARLTDFGLAKALSGTALTATGVAMGTPSYMAPEQVTDAKNVQAAADIYSLGATLYDVLTGSPPYTGKKVSEVISQVLAGRLVPPRVRRPSLDARLDSLCVRALAVDPAARPATAGAFADELDAWLKPTSATGSESTSEGPPLPA
jgi:serine/threonine protein kinase